MIRSGCDLASSTVAALSRKSYDKPSRGRRGAVFAPETGSLPYSRGSARDSSETVQDIGSTTGLGTRPSAQALRPRTTDLKPDNQAVTR